MIRTVNKLPKDYTGKLTVLLNDRENFIVLRNILLLNTLATISDKRKAADIALHLWYSAFIPQEYYTELLSPSLPLAMGSGSLDIKFGEDATLEANIGQDIRMLCAKLAISSRVYGMGIATNELGRVRCVISLVIRPSCRELIIHKFRPVPNRPALSPTRPHGAIPSTSIHGVSSLWPCTTVWCAQRVLQYAQSIFVLSARGVATNGPCQPS